MLTRLLATLSLTLIAAIVTICIIFADVILIWLQVVGVIGLIFIAGAGLITLSIGYQRLRMVKAQADEMANKAVIVSTPHADYTIRSPKRHLVQLTHSPYLEWNGTDRTMTNEERWAWYTQRAHHKGDIIDVAPAIPMLPSPSLPGMVRLPDLLPSLRGDLSRLIIGVKLGDNGQQEPVTISIYDLFHTVVAGSSGWGKSGFMGSLLYQMATAAQKTEFVLIDQQMHGLAPFKNCTRLRYPILRESGEIISALSEVYSEAIGKRSELFTHVDADDLQHYNSLADEPLAPIIVAVDEASALLANKEIGAILKKQAWELRKFGVYQFLMLTSAKGTTIETDHRQQFASKVQLHASDGYQARLLMSAPEAVNFPVGRAMIELPGQHPQIVQTPYIDRREIRQTLPTSQPVAMPQVIEIEPSESDRDAKYKRLVSEGFSRNTACFDAYGRRYSGSLVTHCKRVLGEI